ncbi:MAG: hypothetical protein ACP5VE_00695 [Chthonomonadales bacterium]
MPDEQLPIRVLKTSAWVACLGALLLLDRGLAAWALGWAIGCGLSMLSLASLTYLVPRLVWPARPRVKLLLGVVVLVKLPVLAVVLNYAMASPHVAPLGVFVGAGLTPAIIVLKVLGYQLSQPNASAGGWRCRN